MTYGTAMEAKHVPHPMLQSTCSACAEHGCVIAGAKRAPTIPPLMDNGKGEILRDWKVPVTQ
jgi:hypothetical protein